MSREHLKTKVDTLDELLDADYRCKLPLWQLINYLNFGITYADQHLYILKHI